MSRGGREPRVSDEDILELFRETSDPVLSTAEVADALPIGRRGVLDRLHSLEDEKKLMSKNIGGRNIVWWLLEADEIGQESDRSGAVGGSPETTLDAESDDLDTRETPTVDDGLPDEKVNTKTTAPNNLTDDFGGAVDREQLRDALPGSGDLLERRVDEILGMYTFLKVAGEAEKSHMLKNVNPKSVGYDSKASAWANMVKGRDTLRALPGVEPPRPGMSTWRYTGDE
jgi:hypothetical protein